MRTSTKIGTLTPVIYFENLHHHIMLAPYTGCPTPEGYIRCEADTLPKIDILVDRMRRQEMVKNQVGFETEEAYLRANRERVRDSLMAKLVSSSTSQYDKDIIREYLLLRDEKARQRHRERIESQNYILYAREFDLHGRDAATEEFKGRGER